MEHKVLRRAEKLQKSHTKKHWLYRGLSVLAAGAVFCTTYALILPAITLDKDAICGYDEHTHTDECYTSTGSWACMDDSTCEVTATYEMLANADYVAHTHTDECYNEAGEIICPFADWDNLVEPHEHTDECYQIVVHTHDENCMEMVQGELKCTLEESDGHIHDEGCLGEVPVLICELPEHEFHTDDCYDSNGNIICGMENHVHGDDCYETELVNVCEIEEGEGQHTHTSTCYEYVTEPTCGIEDGAETAVLICEKIALHTHTDACYEDGAPDGVLTCGQPEVILHEHADCYEAGEPELTCEIEEHTHTDECYGTYEEVPGMYNSTAASSGEDFDLTGNWADDLVTVAKSQDGKASVNFGTWYSAEYSEDATNDQAFISWCLHVVGITDDIIPYSTDAESFYETAKEWNILQTEGKPEVGDIVIDNYNSIYMTGIYTGTTGFYSSAMYGDLNGVVGEDMGISPIAWISISSLYDELHPVEPEEPDEPGEGILDGGYDLEVLRALLNSTWFEDHYTHLLTEDDNIATIDNTDSTDTTTTEGKPSAQQINEEGGANTDKADDKVYVSKTIAGTDTENVFDITLRVETDEELKVEKKDPDMAVVIVVDISGTMLKDFSGVTLVRRNYANEDAFFKAIKDNSKFSAAWTAADEFIKTFKDNTQGISQLGIVAFNTDAYMTHSMAPVTDENAYKQGLYEELRKTIVAAAEDSADYQPNSYTNMEAGLLMAQDMLKGVNNSNKFVILVSDGLPTTYYSGTTTTTGSGKTVYEGYSPVCTSGTIGNSGVLGANLYVQWESGLQARLCKCGTNYSDVGAIRARKVAESLKDDNGVEIFTVGIALNGFSGSYNETGLSAEGLIKNQLRRAKDSSNKTNTIDFYKNYEGIVISDTNANDWENIAKKMEVLRYYDDKAFQNWLRYMIGSGDPKDSNDQHFLVGDTSGDLLKAFSDIFDKLSAITQQQWTDAWIVTDPVPDDFGYIGVVENDAVVTAPTEWTVGDATEGYDKNISWNLKKATESTPTQEGYKHAYTITYRVRLKNEATDFVEYNNDDIIYPTNGTTTLTYRVTTKTDGVVTGFKDGTVDFPIPSVHGYLGELTFTKVSRYNESETGTPLDGAKFTLTHYEDCELCKLTQESQTYWSEVPSMNQTKVSGEGEGVEPGIVSFTGIPSGHTYILEETVVPAGHQKREVKYLVYVEYDRVTVKDMNKNVVWKDDMVDDNNQKVDFAIPNYTSVELPNTGGTGTRRYILMGVLLMSTAVLLYTVRRRQRE